MSSAKALSVTSSTPVLDSKSAKKRKAKGNSATPPPAEPTTVNGTVEHDDGSSLLMKELQKQIRNVSKKLQAVHKTEITISAHEGVSLDDLVKQKKINADQKAQVQKKPQLEAQLAQLEEHSKNYTELTADLEARFEKEKASLIEAHEAEIERVKEENSQSSTTTSASKVKEALHVTCQFLHAAAFQRQRDDVEEHEKQAYEAVLFHLYQGNATALETLTKVVEGQEEKVVEPNGDALDFTYAQLRTSAMATLNGEDQPASQADTESEAAPAAPAVEEPESDPTVTHATLTELEDTTTIPISTTDDATNDAPPVVPEQAVASADAGNAAAEAAWAPEASMTSESAEGWVQVQNPEETETGTQPEPAAPQSTSNWADEAGAAAEEQSLTAVTENDGFSEVRRDRGGRGGRGGGRGRGNFDGRGRGRGRGDYRGRGRAGRGSRGAASPAS